MAEPDVNRPKTSASAMVADLWLERERMIAPPPPPPPQRGGRRPGGPGGPRPPRGNSKTGLVAAVVALALLLGGGAGVFLATQGVGMTSKAKFVAKADGVCRQANGALIAISKPTSYPDLATAAGTFVATTDAQLGGLRKLSRPGGADGAAVAGVLAAMTDTTAGARSLQDAAGRKDDAATAAATRALRSSSADLSAKAKPLGFSECVTGMQPGVDAVTGGANGVIKTAFIAKADSMCRATARALAAIAVPKTGNAAIGRYLSQTLQVVQKLLADFRAMPVPPGDESTVADMMAAMDKVNAKWSEAPDAATSGDTSRLNAIDREMGTLSTAADAKLDAYGLGVCGSNFGG